MDDLIELCAGKNFRNGLVIGQIAKNELERFSQRLEFSQIRALEVGIVKLVQVIESPDRMAAIQQFLTDVRPNKTCTAGNQEIHGRTVTMDFQRFKCENP